MTATVETLDDFPAKAYDKLRYGDTDAQGHVNNSVFSTFLETARTEFLYSQEQDGQSRVLDPDCGFVIVRLELDFVAETHWPGTVEIGTRVIKIGTSSLTLQQSVFQDGKVVARAGSVMVQMHLKTRKPHPLSQTAKTRLQGLM